MSQRTKNPPLHVQILVTAGNTQATATKINGAVSPGFVLAAGDDVTGMMLPTAGKGKYYFIKNTGTTQIAGLYVYPFTGQQINSLGANNPILLPMQTGAVFISDGATWHTVPVVPS